MTMMYQQRACNDCNKFTYELNEIKLHWLVCDECFKNYKKCKECGRLYKK